MPILTVFTAVADANTLQVRRERPSMATRWALGAVALQVDQHSEFGAKGAWDLLCICLPSPYQVLLPATMALDPHLKQASFDILCICILAGGP